MPFRGAERPIANGDWWAAKLDRNIARDRQNDLLLSRAGWTVLRFWEHENVDAMVTTVAAAAAPERRL
jgi:DNA mismatch endonuclease, patch repair protein